MAQDSWLDCMKRGVLQATGIGFLTGGMLELIEQQAWKKLATAILKEAGKKALKGGVAGFVASMIWYAGWCAA